MGLLRRIRVMEKIPVCAGRSHLCALVSLDSFTANSKGSACVCLLLAFYCVLDGCVSGCPLLGFGYGPWCMCLAGCVRVTDWRVFI